MLEALVVEGSFVGMVGAARPRREVGRGRGGRGCCRRRRVMVVMVSRIRTETTRGYQCENRGLNILNDIHLIGLSNAINGIWLTNA